MMTDLLQSLCKHLRKISVYGPEFFDTEKLNDLDDHAQERRDFMRLLRLTASWMRSRAIEERPPLFLEERPGRLVLVGNLVIEVDERGCIRVPESMQESEDFRFVKNFAKIIYLDASQVMFSYYGERLHTLLKEKLEGSNVSENFLRKAIDCIIVSLMDEQGWMRGGVRWWSVKSHRTTIMQINRALWDANILRNDICSVAIKIHGYEFSIKKYNAIACSLEQIKERIAEVPNLAPWLQRIDFSSDEMNVSYDTSPEVLKNLKRKFLENGGTEQGWKWLTKQEYKWVNSILPDSFKWYAKPVSLLASLQIGKIPFDLHFVISLQLEIEKYSDPILIKNILYVIKSAVLAYKKRKARLKDIKAMFPLVCDYVKSLEQPLAPKTSWKTLCELQRRWHQEQAWKKAEEARANNQTWPALLDAPLTEGDLVLVELSQSFELFEESEAMGHCVGSYVSQCLEGSSRIFSVRRGEDRLATIELVFSSKNGWFVSQCRGPRNAIITDKAVLGLAKRLEQMCESKAISVSYKTVEHAA